jgi:TolB-like protein/Tfp pilus assembly protein PilF
MSQNAQSAPHADAIRQQLERILVSRVFYSSLRSQALLRYSVEKSLVGAAAKEYEIALAVFERDTDYDPAVDATVRVEAGRLRSRLREYYVTEGQHDPIVIDIPKGGYTAVFTPREPAEAHAVKGNGLSTSVAPSSAPLLTESPSNRAAENAPSAATLLPGASYHRHPFRRAKLWAASLVTCALAAALTGWIAFRWMHAHEPIRSLAVFPLENLSGDPQDYFAEGMTDELTTQLAQIRGLRVVSRTSAVLAGGMHQPLPQIAGDLHIDAVVEGSILRTGNRIRITVQLIDARSDKLLWADNFEGQSNDILSLQDGIARQIASQARIALMPAPASAPAGRKIDPAAFDAYLHGRYFFQKQDMVRSASYFQRAIAIDPSYASAYAGLAAALDAESTFQSGRPDSLLEQALAASERAIQLDPQNGEAYSELGSIQTLYQWDWTAAEQNLTRGIALNPNHALGEMEYAVYLDAVGRPDDAVTHMRRALDLDPMSFFMTRRLGATLYLARRYDQALDELRNAAEMEPAQHQTFDNWMSLAYQMEGMRDEAVQRDIAALHSDLPDLDDASLSDVYKRQGWDAYWRARIGVLKPHSGEQCVPYAIAESDLRLGDRDGAFALLNQLIDQHCFEVLWFKTNPLLDPLRSDPRFPALLHRINLSN